MPNPASSLQLQNLISSDGTHAIYSAPPLNGSAAPLPRSSFGVFDLFFLSASEPQPRLLGCRAWCRPLPRAVRTQPLYHRRNHCARRRLFSPGRSRLTAEITLSCFRVAWQSSTLAFRRPSSSATCCISCSLWRIHLSRVSGKAHLYGKMRLVNVSACIHRRASA